MNFYWKAIVFAVLLFVIIAEDVLENDILNTSDKEKIIGICEKIIKKYQN